MALEFGKENDGWDGKGFGRRRRSSAGLFSPVHRCIDFPSNSIIRIYIYILSTRMSKPGRGDELLKAPSKSVARHWPD